MGGKAIDDDLPPPGSRGGPDDIAAPIQSAEESLKDMTEAEIKKKIEANNKSSIKKILDRKNREDVYGLEDYDTTNMSDIKKEIIRTETKLGNLNPDDPGFREKAKPLVDKITELQKKLRDDKADRRYHASRSKRRIWYDKKNVLKIFSRCCINTNRW
jgi:hypothetical protein